MSKILSFDFIVWSLLVFFLVYFIYWPDHDDTDPLDGRSDLKLFTDSGTGCQYIQGGLFGGIMKRFDSDGKHICLESLKRTE